MKTVTKYLTDTKVEMTISVTSEELSSAKQVALSKIARDLKVPGFRKGKVPIEVAKKNVDPAVLQEEVINNALSRAVAEAFLGENLQALERPAVEVKKFVPDQELEFTAEAEVVPPVKLGDFKKLKSKRAAVKVSDADIDEVIVRMQQSFASKKEAEREAKNGDEAVIDFVGKKDDKPFDGGSATDYGLRLGEGQFIPGFEEGVVGHKAGDEFSLDLKFPKDYHAKELAGAKVVFDVKLKKVNEVVLPELNEEFAAKAGPFTDMDQLKEDIRREISAQKERESTEKFKDALVGELADSSKVALPELLVEDQVRSIEQDLTQNLMYQGLTMDSYLEMQKFASKDDWVKEEARPAAEKRVKAGLVLAELSKEFKIDVSHAELSAQIEQMKQQYGARDEKLAKQFENPDVHRDIANRLITEKTVDKLVKIYEK